MSTRRLGQRRTAAEAREAAARRPRRQHETGDPWTFANWKARKNSDPPAPKG